MIETIYSDPNFLAHYGVKGMKWGVRHDYEPIGRSRSSENQNDEYSNKKHTSNHEKIKKTLKTGAIIGAGILVAYGAHKTNAIGSLANSFKKSANIIYKEGYRSFSDLTASMTHCYSEVWDNAEWMSMSPAEQKAVRAYTGNDYEIMNKFLRGIIKPGDLTANTETLVKKQNDFCTDALEKTRLKEDMTVHRGIGDALSKMLGLEDKDLDFIAHSNPNLLVGTSFTEKGFMSTGASSSSAWGGVKMHINCPKGTKGMYVDPVSLNQGENEILIQRNTKMIIREVKMKGDKISDIIVDIIDQTL